MDIFNLIGVLGGVLYLLSYALLNMGRVRGDSLAYIALNLLAAMSMAVSLSVHWNGPSFAIQLCWILISLISLVRALRVPAKSGVLQA